MPKKFERVAIPSRIRFDIFRRDGYTCRYCGQKPPNTVLELDHIVPVSAGGTNSISNLVTSCFPCNRGKGDLVLPSDDEMEVEHYMWVLQKIQEDFEAKTFFFNDRKHWAHAEEDDELAATALLEVVETIQANFMAAANVEWEPVTAVLIMRIRNYDPWTVNEAAVATGSAIYIGKVSTKEDDWKKYMWGCCRNIAAMPDIEREPTKDNE